MFSDEQWNGVMAGIQLRWFDADGSNSQTVSDFIPLIFMFPTPPGEVHFELCLSHDFGQLDLF